MRIRKAILFGIGFKNVLIIFCCNQSSEISSNMNSESTFDCATSTYVKLERVID